MSALRPKYFTASSYEVIIYADHESSFANCFPNAEYIAGSEDKFVKKMNDKVKELGLKNTVFKNATGLDEDGHFSSAYDMAIIARTLLSHQEILEFSGVYEDYLRVNTPNKFWLVNTNKLVRTYNGADGLKTGHTDNAKYCLAVTAKRDLLQ